MAVRSTDKWDAIAGLDSVFTRLLKAWMEKRYHNLSMNLIATVEIAA